VIEKQTRVVEILLAAVPDRALLGGKIVGNSLLALAETLAISVVALVTLKVTGQSQIFSLLSTPVLWYVVFFVFGFILLASLYAGLAALVSRIEDVGTAVMPMTLLCAASYFGPLLANDSAQAMRVLSYIPVISTVAMPVRMILGQAHWWEGVISLVILILATLGSIWLGGRVYARSLLHTGKALKLMAVLRQG